MEISEALKTTGSIRDYTDEQVSDEVLFDIIDTARFAPSGGNRQAWKVIVVKDPGNARRYVTFISMLGTTTSATFLLD